MTAIARWKHTLIVLAVLAAGCTGSDPSEAKVLPPPSEPAASPAATAAPAALEPVDDAARTALLGRIAMVGASATAGFGAVIDDGGGGSALTTLSHIFAAAVKRAPPPVVTNGGHLMFFNAPMDIGPGLVDTAIRADPTLVVGVDFLFWYGYGRLDKDRRPITDDMARLDLLEEGLAQLDRLGCPLFIGDFPDVSPAIGLMLSAEQVPSPDTLEILNARVHSWAAARPHVTVLPFAALVEAMRTNEPFDIGDRTWPAGSERVLVQPDRLHPTPHGLVAIVQMVVHELLLRFPGLRADDFDLDAESMIGRVQEMMRR